MATHSAMRNDDPTNNPTPWRARLLLCAVAGLVVAIVWVGLTGEQTGSQTPDRTRAATESPEPKRDESVGVGAVAPEVIDGERSPAETGAAGLTVRVIEVDGSPAVAAIVRWGFPNDDPRRRTAESSALSLRDQEAWLERFGEWVTSDASGNVRVVVPTPPSDSRNGVGLCARSGEHYGVGWIRWAEAAGATLEIRLAEDRGFRVKLVDAAGSPVVGFQLIASYRAFDKNFGESLRGRGLGRTAADGSLLVPHVQTWVDGIHAPDGVRRCVVQPSFPGNDAPGTEVDLDHLPSEVVLVVMPPAGSVRVVVEGWRAGTGSRGRVELREARGEGEPDDAPRSSAEIGDDGRAHFPLVALGKHWRVRLGSSTRDVVFDGPLRVGEETEVCIQAVRYPTLVGRLMHDGDALGKTGAWLMAVLPSARPSRHRLSTDEDGKFRLDLYPSELGLALDTLSIVALRAEADETLVARFARPGEVVEGENDLGDVELVGEPPLLTGRLIGWKPRTPVGLSVQTGGATGQFVWADGVVTDRHDDGRFAVRGIAPRGGLRLLVDARDCLPMAPIPFVPGQRDLEVVLQRGGSLRIDLVVGDDRGCITIAPRLLPIDGRPRDAMLALSGFGEPGLEVPYLDHAVPGSSPEFANDEPLTFRFAWEGVPPGRYRLAIFTRGPSAPIAEVPSLEVKSDGDLTLDTIDLRDRIHWITLRFPALLPSQRQMNAQHGLAAPGYVFIEENGRLSDHCLPIESKRVFLAAPHPLDLVIDVHGFRRQTLRGVDRDVDVVLVPGIEVALEVGWPTAPQADDLLDVRLVPLEGAALPRGTLGVSNASGMTFRYEPDAVMCIREGDTLRTRVPVPGRYAIVGKLRDAQGRKTVLRAEPPSCEVGEEGATILVRLILE